MASFSIQNIKKTTTQNLFFLSLRQMALQVVSYLGYFMLTILLGPGQVGLFAIVAESVGILGYFSDIGLAAALIQQKKSPNRRQLQTAFTIQQLLVLVLLIIVSLIYPKISQQKSYGPEEFWITLSLCFAFVSASLKTIPSVLLERQLDFKRLSLVDMVENFTFYLVAVLFALQGFGAYSYAWATFARATLGILLIYRLQPWPLGLSFSFKNTKKLFSFGLPFQFNSFIALAKDRLSSLAVASIIGRQGFGLISWAQKSTRLPLSLMDALMKVTFPTFSRLQKRRQILKKTIARSTYFIALVTFPMLAGISLVAPQFISLIPKYQKWLPAVFPLYFYAFSAAIAAVTTPLTNAFNAIGKITLTTKFMILWTFFTWIFYPLLSLKFGYQGTAYAVFILGLSSLLVWYYAQKIFSVNIFKTIFHPTASTLIMILVINLFSPLFSSPLPLFLAKINIGLITYIGYHLLFAKDQLLWHFHQLKHLKSS